jgi:pyrroline-5-carboxylate reductase
MNHQLKVGFLGAGVMASALIKGLLKSNAIACTRIIASDPIAASRFQYLALYFLVTHSLLEKVSLVKALWSPRTTQMSCDLPM